MIIKDILNRNYLYASIFAMTIIWIAIFLNSNKANILIAPIFLLNFFLVSSPIFALLSKKINLLSPSFYLLFAIALYELPKLFLYVDYDLSIKSSLQSNFVYFDDPYMATLKYQTYTLICLILIFCTEFFLMLNFSKKNYYIKNKSRLANSKTKKAIFLIGMILIFFICLLKFISVTAGDFTYFLSARIGNQEALALKKELYIFILGLIFILFSMPFVFTIVKSKLKYFFFIFVATLFFLYTGSRGFVVFSIISIFFCNYIFNNKTSRSLTYVIFIPAFLILFSILGLARENLFDFTSNSTSDKNIIEKSIVGYQGQIRDELIFDNLEQLDNFRLSSIFTPIFFLVPRSIIGDLKPNMIDGELAKELWGLEDIGLPINISTETILNFGFGGFLYLPFLIFLLLSFRSLMFRLNLEHFYVSSMIFAQTMLSSKFAYVIQLLVILMLINFLVSFFYNIFIRR